MERHIKNFESNSLFASRTKRKLPIYTIYGGILHLHLSQRASNCCNRCSIPKRRQRPAEGGFFDPNKIGTFPSIGWESY
uniref:ribosomal protein S16 n=1 Tax=Swertia przewalskii TaxID=137889 RepID=UPI00226D1F81|nr:ribosomal protein S16 [Swertia przewalskii]UZP15909.1 ribosomal protein S16 [Swertia przewalskii]